MINGGKWMIFGRPYQAIHVIGFPSPELSGGEENMKVPLNSGDRFDLRHRPYFYPRCCFYPQEKREHVRGDESAAKTPDRSNFENGC